MALLYDATLRPSKLEMLRTWLPVLGERWVYDACGDPVWAAALATTVLTGGTEVEQVMEEGRMVVQTPTATVRGSGSADELVPDVDTVSGRQSRSVVRRSRRLSDVTA